MDGRLGEHNGCVLRAASRPLLPVRGLGVVHRVWGGQHSVPVDRKVNPRPMLPLATPSQRDSMPDAHVDVCGPEPHTSRVAAQVERDQRPHADCLRHWHEGLVGERALGPGAPSLVVPPPRACFRRAGEFSTARGSGTPTQGSCARVTRPRTRVGPLRNPLGRPVPTTAPLRLCGRPPKWAPRFLGATRRGLVWGGVGLHHVPTTPLVYHHLPTVLRLDPPSSVPSLSPWVSLSLLLYLLLSFLCSFLSRHRLEESPLDSSPL